MEGFVVGEFAVEGWCRSDQFPKGDDVAVFLACALHLDEGIVGDIAGETHVGLDAPVPSVFLQLGHVVEEAAVETAHVVVALHSAVRHFVVFLEYHGFLCALVV